jgi:hypothetical protein
MEQVIEDLSSFRRMGIPLCVISFYFIFDFFHCYLKINEFLINIIEAKKNTIRKWIRRSKNFT